MSLDRRQVAISYTQHLSENGGGVGFALIHLGVDNIDGRNINGQRTGSLSDSENAILLSFSPDIHARISVGLTMKLLVYRLGGQSAKGFGGDIGFIARPIDPLSVGFIFRDVGTRITWDTAGLFSRNVQRSEILIKADPFWALSGAGLFSAVVVRLVGCKRKGCGRHVLWGSFREHRIASLTRREAPERRSESLNKRNRKILGP